MFILSKCVFWIQIQVLNSYYILSFNYSISFLPYNNWSKEVMSNSFALREFTIPPWRETRSPLGFSDKSAKKSRNFICFTQKPSILPRSCPTCWDITETAVRPPATTGQQAGEATMTTLIFFQHRWWGVVGSVHVELLVLLVHDALNALNRISPFTHNGSSLLRCPHTSSMVMISWVLSPTVLRSPASSCGLV
jgi:hypothetical protein